MMTRMAEMILRTKGYKVLMKWWLSRLSLKWKRLNRKTHS